MQSAPQSMSLTVQPDEAKGRGMPAPPYTYPMGIPAAAAFPARQPRDYVVWSLFNFFFLNVCCLGFMALIFSFKSRDRKLVGDVEGATSYGNTAKSLNIAALLLTLLIITLVIVLFATGVIALKQFINQMDEERLNTFDDFVQRHGK